MDQVADRRAVYTVSVRELCEFAAKTGDLDFRFTPSPTSQQGVAGHRVVAARRAARCAAYRAEMSLEGTFDSLTVRGRADGFDEGLQLLEEVKTYKGELGKMPANHTALHWAQAKVYGWLLCAKLNLADLKVSVVYFDVGSEIETLFTQTFTAQDLRQTFEQLCRAFIEWSSRELEHRRRRNDALRAVRFPYGEFRTGQRQLAENTYIAASRGRCLLAQAPTGIGKTVGTRFPMLKAMAASPLDKVFFLTAKRSGRQVALDALKALGQVEPDAPLRVLELVSRERACEHPDKACHGDSCPLAKGFYDRLPRARSAAVDLGAMDRSATRTTALTHGICPYYLQQELVRWADVVIGDYNHFFDESALLHALTRENEWRVGVLVDEAHNLVERARSMYSAKFESRALATTVRTAPRVLAKPLRRVQRAWKALSDEQAERYRVLDAVPEKFADALRAATTAMGEFMAEYQAGVDADLLRFYFDALRFAQLVESFDQHFIFDISLEHDSTAKGSLGRTSTLAIRNVVPADFLRARFASAHAAVLFSATLSPMNFYTDMLGMPANTARLDVESPFIAEQLRVRIVDHVPTSFAKRTESLGPIARVMAEQFELAPGNYLAFFSSFDYMQRACETFCAKHPTVPVWT